MTMWLDFKQRNIVCTLTNSAHLSAPSLLYTSISKRPLASAMFLTNETAIEIHSGILLNWHVGTQLGKIQNVLSTVRRVFSCKLMTASTWSFVNLKYVCYKIFLIFFLKFDHYWREVYWIYFTNKSYISAFKICNCSARLP